MGKKVTKLKQTNKHRRLKQYVSNTSTTMHNSKYVNFTQQNLLQPSTRERGSVVFSRVRLSDRRLSYFSELTRFSYNYHEQMHI